MSQRISKLLIANRGEIACRIVKTARKLGIKTVAVYSEVDQNSKNVLMSDEAYCIGKASSRDSYLNQEKIVNIAKEAKCNAIHPGYGFLSENAAFSDYCWQNGIIFIGPPASAIRDMGIKNTSKKLMNNAGVPVIPGYHENDQSDSTLKSEAIQIGFPLMIKAVYGGGGKGMRIVLREEDFLSQLESARRESMNSFGDDSVLLERFITAPRHVEVQVFADQYGNCVHLNERDCSIQRRHQKVIEEAPAPGIDTSLRQEIGSAAVRAAQAVKYVGAGTVEFIYDEVNRSFYFMEMNTRLQVEHPVTEMITNIDLVEWQIKVASGEKLPLKQDDIPLVGHSVEARIYAEDPFNEFLPDAGLLAFFSQPHESKDVRVETGVREGDEVSVHYDPLIAKLVVWGENRDQAFWKLHTKLLECNIVGLKTNIEFLTNLSTNDRLLKGQVSTAFIEENKDVLLQRAEPSDQTIAEAALGIILNEERKQKRDIQLSNDKYDPFLQERGFRVNHLHVRNLKLIGDSRKEYNVEVTYRKSNFYSVSVDDRASYEVNGRLITSDENKILLVTNFRDIMLKCGIFIEDENENFIHLFTQEGPVRFKISHPDFSKFSDEKHAINAVAPMPGIVSKIFVKPGNNICAGDPVMVVIAMKMEHVIKSPKDGIINEVLFEVGQSVPKQVPVITFLEK